MEGVQRCVLKIILILLQGRFFSKLQNREEFEGGLEKRKGKGGKEEKQLKCGKTHVKIPL